MFIALEESRIIQESVSGEEVVSALNQRRAVVINYDDEKSGHTGTRYIEPYAYGITKAGNPCFRAYQYWGDTKRGVPKWKLFRLDRVISWNPTDNTFDLEPRARGWAAEAFNNNGDGTMSAVYKIVNLDDGNQMTQYEKLKDRTRKMQSSTPVNIYNTGPVSPDNSRQRENDEVVTSTSKPSDVIPNDMFNDMVSRNAGEEKPRQGAIDTTKQQKQEPTQIQTTGPEKQEAPKENIPSTGPIQGATDPEKHSAEELMNNKEFMDMVRRNLSRK